MEQYCWEIIQCDDKESCSASLFENRPCWEVMQEHNSFQCYYGLCEECIVHLAKTGAVRFSENELAEALQYRLAIPKVY